MADEGEVQNYIDISISALRTMEEALPFDLYVRRTEKDYTKIFKKDELLDWNRVKSYTDKGIQSFSIDSLDYAVYVNLVDSLASEYLQKTQEPNPKKVATMVQEMVGLCATELIVQHQLEPETVKKAQQIVQGCVTILDKEPGELIKIMRQISIWPELVRHSIMTSFFGVILARALGMESKINLIHIGMGGFLHDIGVSQLEFNPDEVEVLSAEQRKDMKSHPELGKALLDNISGVTAEVRSIVLNHHEQPNGAGYPNRLRGRDFFSPAKIIAVVDQFSVLITPKPFRKALTPKEALNRMTEDQGKFDSAILSTFKKCFYL